MPEKANDFIQTLQVRCAAGGQSDWSLGKLFDPTRLEIPRDVAQILDIEDALGK